MSQPLCPGWRKAVPGHSRWHGPNDFATCDYCGQRMRLIEGCFPKHRRRTCMVAGCTSYRVSGVLCREHARDIVGAE